MEIDKKMTLWVYDNIGRNNYLRIWPYYLGFVPYELFVLPLMFFSIAYSVFFDTLKPLQIYLLPMWVAYSIVKYIKGSIKRLRPGCNPNLKMGKFIDSKHCNDDEKNKSFPSGHTIMSFSLATSLSLYCQDAIKKLHQNSVLMNFCIGIYFFIATLVGIQRIQDGYHHVSDVCVGAILGIFIGYFSYKFLDPYADMFNNRVEVETSNTYFFCKNLTVILCIFAIVTYYLYRVNIKMF